MSVQYLYFLVSEAVAGVKEEDLQSCGSSPAPSPGDSRLRVSSSGIEGRLGFLPLSLKDLGRVNLGIHVYVQLQERGLEGLPGLHLSSMEARGGGAGVVGSDGGCEGSMSLGEIVGAKYYTHNS